jgi:TPR repeat protein
VEYLKQCSEAGDAFCQSWYVNQLWDGDWIGRDRYPDVKYEKLAADQRIAESLSKYGRCLINGAYVSRDSAEGRRYLKLAAEQGNKDS